MVDLALLAVFTAAALALLLATAYGSVVIRASAGSERMRGISAAIREGTMAFLSREYIWAAGFVTVMALAIGFLLPWGIVGAAAYVLGAGLSALAGLIGIRIATAANSRTAAAAQSEGLDRAVDLAFKGGAVMGFTVAGLGLAAVGTAYIVLSSWLGRSDWPQIIAAIALGASSLALFARVGGGIFTKAADVGADLVGKIEAEIPEDDPRNPAVIADNVGDNVGDVAGTGADLFESFVGALVAALVYAAIVFADRDILSPSIALPLAVAAAGTVASIIGSFLVRPNFPMILADNLLAAIRWGTLTAALLTAGASWLLVRWLFEGVVEHPLGLFLAIAAGIVVGLVVELISEWFTSDHHKTVKEVARHAQTGAATFIISGLAEGMRSAAFSVMAVAAGVYGAFVAGEWAIGQGGGMYGVALAAVGVLATLGIAMSIDAYGPIADNARGIAAMAQLPPEVQANTNALDALGNTTASVAKGFASAAAGLTALALFGTFAEAADLPAVDLTQVPTIAGLFVGAMFPFLFASLTMNAVGRAAAKMIDEVRRQFRDIDGLREGRDGVLPDYNACVRIATSGALREMILPASLALAAPVFIGLFDFGALGAFLVGALITGFLLAVFMVNAGGAWDNAKRLIETGAFGGIGSDSHKAAMIGDAVGDPFKDTSGPAINIVIKVMTIVALIFSALFVR